VNILAFDTALDACSAAVWSDGKVVAAESVAAARGHAEILFPMLARVLEKAAIGYEAIDRFAVTIGPGSFTGVRVGVAAARGLALSMAKPAVGITTLEAIAAAVFADQAEATSGSTSLAIALDARRGEIYLQVFAAPLESTSLQLVPLTDPEVIALGEAARRLPAGRVTVVGSGASLLEQAAGASADIRRLERPLLPDAGVLAALAAARPLAQDTPPPSPLYLRAPDAKLPDVPATTRDRIRH
jgi:tRNA threonylcarbamoyladenosine biosynthesis protein TsaB